MRIKNNSNKKNYVNFKAGGMSKRIEIPASKVINIPSLSNMSQILNSIDFKLGRLEVVKDVVEAEVVKKEAKKESSKKKTTTTKKKTTKSKTSTKKDEKENILDKVEREVKGYTGKEDKEEK